MKRITAVLIVISLLAMVMTGCGKDETSEKGSSGWEIKCLTTGNEPVANVRFQVCGKNLCRVIDSDEDGIAKFSGNEKKYTLHFVAAPDEYVLSEDCPDELNSEENTITIVFSKK